MYIRVEISDGRCFAIRRLASLLDRKRAIKRAERAYLAKRRREEGGGRKLVHESVVARDRVAVVHERAIHETIMIGRLVRAYLAVSLSAIKSVI